MSATDDKPHPAEEKARRPEPKRTRWQETYNALGQSTRRGIIGTFIGAKKTLDFLNSVSPFLTVLATIGIVWIAYWQWDALEKTDQTTRAVNRAFVRGKTLNIEKGALYGLNWWIAPVIENTGNTEAKNMEVFVDDAFALNEVNVPPAPDRRTPAFAPQDPEDAYAQKKQTFPAFSRIPLGAKSSTVVGGFGPTTKHIEEMAKNRSDGYVSGVIWYDDVFLRSERHISKFCFVIQPVKKGDDPTTMSFGLCQYWNCADDECAEHKKQYNSAAQALNSKRP